MAFVMNESGSLPDRVLWSQEFVSQRNGMGGAASARELLAALNESCLLDSLVLILFAASPPPSLIDAKCQTAVSTRMSAVEKRAALPVTGGLR